MFYNLQLKKVLATPFIFVLCYSFLYLLITNKYLKKEKINPPISVLHLNLVCDTFRFAKVIFINQTIIIIASLVIFPKERNYLSLLIIEL
jgi:hypothetical protein